MAGAGLSKENIVSQALLYIGESPISAFTEGTGGVVASNLYATTRDDLLTATRWRFASKKATLARLTATPTNEWNYQFQLPTDLLMLIRTYPTSTYEIYEDKLYSNNYTVEIDYIFRPDVVDFPAYFVKALGYKLAAEFAITITNNVTLSDLMGQRALMALKEARFKDAQGRANTSIQDRPWIDVRQ